MSAYEYIKNELEQNEVQSSVFTIDNFKEQMFSEFENGKPIGETTHFPELDKSCRLKHGKLYIATGYPNHGKTEFTLQLCLLQAVLNGKKVAIYSPEAEPIEVFDTLIQTYIGKPLINYNFKKMSFEEYKNGADFISKHFFIIQPENESLETLIKCFEYTQAKFNTSIIVIDPYNEIDLPAESISERTRKIAKEIKKLTKKNNWLTFLVVHPTGEAKDKTGKRVVPTLFNLEGGRMLGNKADVVFTVDRPNKEDPGDLTTKIIFSKVKNQKLMGNGGAVEFTFDRTSNRYLLNGFNPLNTPNNVNLETGDVIYNPNHFTNFNTEKSAPW